jgi:hypothetical protein
MFSVSCSPHYSAHNVRLGLVTVRQVWQAGQVRQVATARQARQAQPNPARRQARSRPMSSAVTVWVSAPTATESTPVAA